MSKLYKYPRTPHLPFSEGATADDRILKDTKHFEGKEVIITEKMDGENTTIYPDGYHARSLDSAHRDYHSYLLGAILPIVQPILPKGYRACGEYLYAKHSIGYSNLEDYFLLFSLWIEDECLSWDATQVYLALNERLIKTVPVLYRGVYDESKVKKIAKSVVARGGEGIVVRVADSFNYEDFDKSVAKYVRPNHVQTDQHWSLGKIEKNTLKKEDK